MDLCAPEGTIHAAVHPVLAHMFANKENITIQAIQRGAP